jgi:hypothetical protein
VGDIAEANGDPPFLARHGSFSQVQLFNNSLLTATGARGFLPLHGVVLALIRCHRVLVIFGIMRRTVLSVGSNIVRFLLGPKDERKESFENLNGHARRKST